MLVLLLKTFRSVPDNTLLLCLRASNVLVNFFNSWNTSVEKHINKNQEKNNKSGGLPTVFRNFLDIVYEPAGRQIIKFKFTDDLVMGLLTRATLGI